MRALPSTGRPGARSSLLRSWAGGATDVLRPARHDRLAVALAVLPPVAAALGGMTGWGSGSRREAFLTGSTAIGNGFCEELLWRGLYAARYPDDRRLGVVWRSLWFAVWHLAPGSMGDVRRLPALVAGAGLLGLTYGTIARRTGSIRWSVASHTLCGFAMTAPTLLSPRFARRW